MSNLKEWVEDRQENGDDGTGYEGEDSKCITCKKTKDRFSMEWEYQQCQACSM